MNEQETALLQELRTLRHGDGMAGSLDTLSIPLLRALSATEQAAGDDLRTRVGIRVERAIESLNQEDGEILSTLLNLRGFESAVNLSRRKAALADKKSFSERTILRKEGQALEALAAQLLRCEWHPATPWSVLHLDVLLRLDAARPEAWETRHILAHDDGVQDVTNTVDIPTVPGADARTELEILYGAVRATDAQRSERNLVSAIQLPNALRRGERHTYAQLVRAERIADWFACTPNRPHTRFTLRVRFGQDRMPPKIWRLSDVFTRVFDEHTPSLELLVPDSAGEVHANFDYLESRLSYGIRWSWS